MEFNGTKGKWSLHKHAFCCVVSDKALIANCGGRTTNINPDALIREQTANAQLISKAPEMLEMLKDIKDYLGSDKREQVEQLIKEAAEI